MAVRLFARGSDGKVMISTGGTSDAVRDDYMANPKKNISNIFFHSDLNYMSLESVITASVTFPFRARQTQTTSGKKSNTTYDVASTGSQVYTLGGHGLGYVPFCTTARGSSQVTPSSPFVQIGKSFRLLNITMDTGAVYVNEQWLTYQYDLPAVTETFTVWIFRNPA